MNSVSWLIYAAEAISNLQHVFVLFSILGSVSLVAWNVLGVAIHNDCCSPSEEREFLFYPAAYLAAMIVCSAVIPSRNTIYLIAASELGEKALQTEVASDMLDIVKKELKKMKDAM